MAGPRLTHRPRRPRLARLRSPPGAPHPLSNRDALNAPLVPLLTLTFEAADSLVPVTVDAHPKVRMPMDPSARPVRGRLMTAPVKPHGSSAPPHIPGRTDSMKSRIIGATLGLVLAVGLTACGS